MSVANQTLLVELLTEELPPKALKKLGEGFALSLSEYLRDDGFLASESVVLGFATPRRLAVSITNVLSLAPDREVVERLMPKAQAQDASGNVTPALHGRLRKIGRPHLASGYPDAWDGPDHLFVKSDGKAEYVWFRSLAAGTGLMSALQSALEDAIAKLPIPKVMSYAGPGSYYNEHKFVRPAHRLVALHGPDVVPVQALGLDADRMTAGHRFLGRRDLEIRTADAYAPTLEAEGKVLPDFAARRERIIAGLHAAAAGANVVMPDALLDEVTALVEWPKVYTGGFDAAFLEVPQECLILTMQQNQKYFALADDAGQLKHRFLLVSNIETQDPAAIIQGNERVLRARLADAKFFYDQDRKTSLAARVDKLRGIVYHNKLGTQADRTARLRAAASRIALIVGADAALAERAALLAKADLVTDMVGEFPELQGTMGRYYARHDGEAPEVADAIAEHYQPRHAGDALPVSGVAQSLALADKFDALAGMFEIGQLPTGDRDPFGLRRAALGVIRILIERKRRLPLSGLVDIAFDALAQQRAVSRPSEAVLDFLYERLRGYLRERGYTANQVAAVVDSRPECIDDLPERLEAVRAFEALPEALSLSAANKRIVNILRKAQGEGGGAVDLSVLVDGAERALHAAFDRLKPVVESRVADGDFSAALQALASTKPTVDRFFDDVMVMADDPKIRGNRLALLRQVAATMNHVADISKLAV